MSGTVSRPVQDREETAPEPAHSPAGSTRSARRRTPPLHLPVLAGLAAALLVALVVTLVTDQVAPLVAVVLGVAVAAHSSRLGWRTSLGVVLAGALVAELLLLWLAPKIGGSLGTDNLVAWTLAGLVHVALAATKPPVLDRRRLVDLGAILVAPAIVGSYFLLAAGRDGRPWVNWAMAMDTANNVILTRQLVIEGGLLTSQGNAAPLATGLYGSWAAPGLDALAYHDVVARLIWSGGQLGVLMWMVVGVAASVIALRTPGGHPGRRVLIATVAGLLPWAWFGAGYAFAYGYQNAGPAVLLLLLSWICWRERSTAPVAALTGLVLCTWATATAWGPVAAFPAFLMLATAALGWRAWRRAGWTMLVPGVTFCAAAFYALRVTRSDVSANSSALAFDGAHPNFDFWRVLVVVGFVAVVTLLTIRKAPRNAVIGFWVALAAGGFVLRSLINARVDVGADFWGYYPIKYTWIATTALVLVFFGEIHPGLGRVASRVWGGGGVLLAALVAFTMMFQMSPPLRPVSIALVGTPIAMHDTVALDAAAKRMLTLIERDPKSIASRFSPAPGGVNDDAFINFWILEMAAATTADPMRGPAYTMSSGDAASVCATIALWGDDVTVWTRDPALKKELVAACDPQFDFKVVVLPAEGQG